MKNPYFCINQSLKKIQLLRYRSMLQKLRPIGLHPNQLPILHYIQEHKDCSQIQLSEDLALTPAAITLATQRLQRDGLLQKTVNPENLREKRLSLTQKGEEKWLETRAIFEEVDGEMFQDFSAEEVEKLQEVLDRLVINMSGEGKNEISLQTMTRLIRTVEEEEKDGERGNAPNHHKRRLP